MGIRRAELYFWYYLPGRLLVTTRLEVSDCRPWAVRASPQKSQPGCISLKSDFRTVLEKIQFFFIISKLFDNNNSYALSTRNRKCANTCIILGEARTYRGQNLNKMHLKNVQKH